MDRETFWKKKKKKHKSYGWSNILPNPRPCSFLSSFFKFLYKKKTTNKEGTLIITFGRRNVWHNKVLELVHTFCHSHGERDRNGRSQCWFKDAKAGEHSIFLCFRIGFHFYLPSKFLALMPYTVIISLSLSLRFLASVRF